MQMPLRRAGTYARTMDPGSAAHRYRAAPRPGNASPSLRGAKRRSNPESKQVLDCFAYARNDAEAHTLAFPRHSLPGFCADRWPFRKQRAQGKPGTSAYPQPRAQSERAHELVTTGPPDIPGLPCATGFNGCSALFLVIGLSCHHRRRSSRQLDISVEISEPRGFAVRLLARSSFRTTSVHRILHPTVRDDREAPL